MNALFELIAKGNKAWFPFCGFTDMEFGHLKRTIKHTVYNHEYVPCILFQGLKQFLQARQNSHQYSQQPKFIAFARISSQLGIKLRINTIRNYILHQCLFFVHSWFLCVLRILRLNSNCCYTRGPPLVAVCEKDIAVSLW